MKRFLLKPLPGTACSWRQTASNQVDEQKKKLSLSKLGTLSFLILLMVGCSMLSVAQTQTFYSNGSYVVPPGVTTVTITGVGGAGGSGGQDCGNGCGYNPGAPGRSVSQSFTVSPGTSLSVYIGRNGGNGGSNTSGGGVGSGGSGYYNGGNGGRTGTSGNSGGGGGGGGATAVIGSGVTLIAGGGGGGGGRCNTANSGTPGSYATGGSGSSSGGTGSSSGISDGGGGGGGGGGVNGGSGGGLYPLNGEFAGIGGNSGSSTSGNSTSTSSPHITISYTAKAGSISPSSQSICAGTQPSSLTLTGSAGYIQWQYSTNGSTFYNITGATSATLTSAQMGSLTSTRYYRAVVSGTTYSTTTVTVKALPTTPSSAGCSSTTQNTATLSWGASTAGDAITYYWVVGTNSSVTYGNGIAQEATSSTSVTATGLSANTTYYLRVYASTDCSNSSYQTSAPFLTVPLAPVANSASVIRSNSFTANWSASTGATSYYLDVATNSEFTSFVPGYQNKNVGNVTSYGLTGLNNTTNYYYRVRAINGGGASVNSSTISLTTLPVNNFLIEKVDGGNIGTQLAGQPFSIKITARDAENTTVTDYNGHAAITTNSILTDGETTANFTAGVLSSHSVALTQAGISNKSLTATIASPSVTSTSNLFTIDPAAINQFILVANGPITAGTSFTVTATVYDQYGNIKTNYDGANEVMWSTTATSSLNGTARVIPANGNQTFNHGVAANISGFTFYNSMETPTITITDAPSSKPGTTAAITVLNAPLNNFKVVAGTSQISGIPFSASVTARDIYWNTCIDYTGNIYFNSSADFSPVGTIIYSKEKQPFTGYNGVRTFSNLATINPVGVYWLSVTDEESPGKSGQQQNIVVEPGAFEKSASINLNLISTLEVDQTERVAGDDVIVTITPRDAQGNLLYSCRDISVLLNGANFHLAGANNTSVPIVVNNLGNGSYTATVRLTKSGDNTISATFNDSDPIVPFDQTREIYVTPAATHHYILNAPTDIIAGGTRAAYTVSRYDVFDNLKTEGVETVYLTSTSDGVNKGFYFESTDGNAVESITFADGSASANFWYYDEKAGNWIISVSDATPEDGATGIIDATDVITINPAPADHLALNVPGNITAGSVTRAAYIVTLQDAYNNTATTSGSSTTVSLSSSSTGTNKKFYTVASGGTATTQVTLAAGVSSANFWYYDEKTGDHTITANTAGMNDGTDEISVMPDLLKEFVISGVSDPHDLGVLQSVTVEVLDTYDNIKTDYVGTILFGSSDLQAKKPAQYQFSEADKGIHTFANEVEFSQPGEFYLKAWDIDEPFKFGFQYNITVQRAVTITANARTKTYGDALTLGTTGFTVTGADYTDVNGNSVSPVIDGDITGITLNCLGAVATANVAGSPYEIVPSGAIFKSGVNSEYYRIEYDNSGLLTVNPKTLVIGVTADNKTYDGTVTATTNASIISGLINDDVVSISSSNGEFEDKDSGIGKNVNVNIGITGVDAGNYTLTNSATATADISKLDLVGSFTAEDKTYDGTTDATITGYSVATKIGEEDVNIDGGTAAFDTKDQGTGKTVTLTGAGLTGVDKDNYNLASVITTTADISKLDLVGSFTADDKTYDGTTDATITGYSVATKIGEEDVNIDGGTAAFDTKDQGTGKTVTLTGAGLTGADKDNYNLASVTTATADITQKALTITANDKRKEYDGKVYSRFTVSYDGFVIGEDETGLAGTLSFSGDATTATSVGAYTIIPEGLTSGNYDISIVSGSLEIVTSYQIITFDALSNKAYGDAGFILTATTSSGLPVSYISSDEFVAIVSGSTVTITGIGTTNITATQIGNNNYNAANPIVQTLIVVKYIAGDVNRDGQIGDGEIAGDTNGDGQIGNGEIAGDTNGDGQISDGEVAGDTDGDGQISDGEVAGDTNGDGQIGNGEIAGDTNGDGQIGNGEIAGDTNGDGQITDPEIAGDTNGDGQISDGEIVGDTNGDGQIADPEIAGDTNGDGKITAPEIAGDTNGDGTIGDGEVAEDKIANISILTIDGTVFENPVDEIYYLVDCGDEREYVSLSFGLEGRATTEHAYEFEMEISAPGIYREDIHVTSADRTNNRTYQIIVEKRFDFEDIVIQKYNNVLLVNNNPDTNGGHRFASFSWFRNGQLIGTDQSYSAGDDTSDRLDLNAQYSVEMKTEEGDVLQTCAFAVTYINSFSLKVAPNPVAAGSKIDVITTYTPEMLAGLKITVSNFNGAVIMQESSRSNNSRITLPSSFTPGTYVVTTQAGGVVLSAKIIVQ